jgi:hypothetical protein
MAALMLTGVLGTGGFSSGGGRRVDLDGDFGIDFVRTRGVKGVDGAADGLDGDGARERLVGGAKVVFTVGREDEALGRRDIDDESEGDV